MSSIGLAYQEYDFYEELFEKPRKLKRKKEPTSKFQLNIRTVQPKTPNQQLVWEYFNQNRHMVLHGMAGTGKTFVTLYLALNRLFENRYDQKKVVIVRSVVPTRDMGFLPGSESDKMKAYEAPYKTMCDDLFSRGDAYEILKTKRQVEFISTSHLRGTTLDDCIIIVDEFQNLNAHEINSIMTRVGVNTQIMLCGDGTQSDLDKPWDQSGTSELLRIADHIDSMEVVTFGVDDIVRSGFVREWLIAREELGIM